MKEKLKKNWPYILIYFIIIVLLYFHHKYICMYFDDFGNASLSYSHAVEGVYGTKFNFSQLLESAIFTYNNYGGRVLYGMIASLLLKDGIKAFMMTQIFVITGIFVFIHLIVNNITKKNGVIIPISCMVLYCLFDITILRHGVYWASASILYVWPMLPLFALIYYYLTVMDKIKKNKKENYFKYMIINLFLIVFAVFSQEQIGVGLIAFLCVYILFDHLKKEKKYLKYDLFTLILSIATYLFLFLAPGNWKRMDKSTEFSKLSLFSKIKTNLPKVFDILFKVKTSVYINIMVAILLIFIISYFLKKYKKSKKYYLLTLPIIGMSINFIIFEKQLYEDLILLTGLGFIVLLSAFIVFIVYYYDRKKLQYLAFPISAVCSVFCLLMAPYMMERTALPFMFILFIAIISVGVEVLTISKTTKAFIALLFVICIYYGINNYIEVYQGYKENYKINQQNYKKMDTYNKKKGKIKMCKVKNSTYGSTQPYETNYDYWLKQYFDIPYEVNLEWNDCNG